MPARAARPALLRRIIPPSRVGDEEGLERLREALARRDEQLAVRGERVGRHNELRVGAAREADRGEDRDAAVEVADLRGARRGGGGGLSFIPDDRDAAVERRVEVADGPW